MSSRSLTLPILALPLLLLIAGCTRPTAYLPAAAPGGEGYSDVRLQEGRFQVTFQGNEATPRQTVELSLLHRAAEVTVANGYDHFVVLDRDLESRTRVLSTVQPIGGPAFSYHWGHPGWAFHPHPLGVGPWGYGRLGYGFSPYGDGPWGYGPGVYGPGVYGPGVYGGLVTTRALTRYQAMAEIQAYAGPAPDDIPAAFDAREVLANLGPVLVRPAGG